MNVRVRPASLQDGVAVLELLEEVGYYPEPIAFAKTYRKTLSDPHFLVRVAEADGKIVGMATLSMRYQLGLGGLLACLDELAWPPARPRAWTGPAAGHGGQGPLPRRPPHGHQGERGHAAAPRGPTAPRIRIWLPHEGRRRPRRGDPRVSRFRRPSVL